MHVSRVQSSGGHVPTTCSTPCARTTVVPAYFTCIPPLPQPSTSATLPLPPPLLTAPPGRRFSYCRRSPGSAPMRGEPNGVFAFDDVFEEAAALPPPDALYPAAPVCAGGLIICAPSCCWP